jgi:hypothetical protein
MLYFIRFNISDSEGNSEMRGEFIGVSQELFSEIFQPLEELDEVDNSLFLDLFRDSIPKPVEPHDPVPLDLNEDGEIFLPGDLEADAAYKTEFSRYQQRLEAYTDASSQEDLAWNYFQEFIVDPATTEAQIVNFLEDAFEVLQESGGDELSNDYYRKIERFLEKYSLRYDLRRPFSLHPTLPGLFARLIRDLKEVTSQDAALSALMHDFEEAVRDLKSDRTPRKIKQCLAAQFNLLEALLSQAPGVVAYNDAAEIHNQTASRRQQRKLANTFGAMCDKAGVWPHDDVLKSAKALYGFGSDYPGIRHGGTSRNAKREIDMRDLIAMSITLAGFTPYFSASLNAEKIFAD